MLVDASLKIAYVLLLSLLKTEHLLPDLDSTPAHHQPFALYHQYSALLDLNMMWQGQVALAHRNGL